MWCYLCQRDGKLRSGDAPNSNVCAQHRPKSSPALPDCDPELIPFRDDLLFGHLPKGQHVDIEPANARKWAAYCAHEDASSPTSARELDLATYARDRVFAHNMRRIVARRGGADGDEIVEVLVRGRVAALEAQGRLMDDGYTHYAVTNAPAGAQS